MGSYSEVEYLTKFATSPCKKIRPLNPAGVGALSCSSSGLTSKSPNISIKSCAIFCCCKKLQCTSSEMMSGNSVVEKACFLILSNTFRNCSCEVSVNPWYTTGSPSFPFQQSTVAKVLSSLARLNETNFQYNDTIVTVHSCMLQEMTLHIIGFQANTCYGYLQ